MDLKRSHVFGGCVFGRLAEKLGEAANMIRVGVDGCLRQVAEQHVIRHAFSELTRAVLPWCHRGSPVRVVDRKSLRCSHHNHVTPKTALDSKAEYTAGTAETIRITQPRLPQPGQRAGSAQRGHAEQRIKVIHRRRPSDPRQPGQPLRPGVQRTLNSNWQGGKKSTPNPYSDSTREAVKFNDPHHRMRLGD